MTVSIVYLGAAAEAALGVLADDISPDDTGTAAVETEVGLGSRLATAAAVNQAHRAEAVYEPVAAGGTAQKLAAVAGVDVARRPAVDIVGFAAHRLYFDWELAGCQRLGIVAGPPAAGLKCVVIDSASVVSAVCRQSSALGCGVESSGINSLDWC